MVSSWLWCWTDLLLGYECNYKFDGYSFMQSSHLNNDLRINNNNDNNNTKQVNWYTENTKSIPLVAESLPQIDQGTECLKYEF